MILDSLRIALLVSSVAGAAANASPTAVDDVLDGFQPVFETVDCGELVNGADREFLTYLRDPSVTCGRVAVPADWQEPNDRRIRLAVYRIASTNDSPAPDPVVSLNGGPGQSGVARIDFLMLAKPLAYLRDRSEVIAIDQRGTGYSEPGLFCFEAAAARQAVDGLDENGFVAPGRMTGGRMPYYPDELDAFRGCRDRLLESGVRFEDYTTDNSALDVIAVHRALEVPPWNLVGVSYGTSLAQAVLRKDPGSVRSVVLDSVVPLDVNSLSKAPDRVYWAMTRIVANCASDPECAASHPNIGPSTETGIARLDSEAIGDFTVDEHLSLLELGIESPRMPRLVSLVAVRRVERPNADHYDEPCAIFDVPAATSLAEPALRSDVPAPGLSSMTDGITPAPWSRRVAASLPNSRRVSFPIFGHDVMGAGDPCVGKIVLAFLDDPRGRPDRGCVATMPQPDLVPQTRRRYPDAAALPAERPVLPRSPSCSITSPSSRLDGESRPAPRASRRAPPPE